MVRSRRFRLPLRPVSRRCPRRRRPPFKPRKRTTTASTTAARSRPTTTTTAQPASIRWPQA
ncbi:hypothetical protein XM57_28465 [Burkholderia cepacia]|nr:hypothetical protein XM57_28465 [Burkholderia cepacia]